MVYIYEDTNHVRILKDNLVIFEGSELTPGDLAVLLHRYFNTGVKYEKNENED
jgi:hypothetical protein